MFVRWRPSWLQRCLALRGDTSALSPQNSKCYPPTVPKRYIYPKGGWHFAFSLRKNSVHAQFLTLHHVIIEFLVICCVATRYSKWLQATRKTSGTEADPPVQAQSGNVAMKDLAPSRCHTRVRMKHRPVSGMTYKSQPALEALQCLLSIYQLNEKQRSGNKSSTRTRVSKEVPEVWHLRGQTMAEAKERLWVANVPCTSSILLVWEQSPPPTPSLRLELHHQNVMRHEWDNA